MQPRNRRSWHVPPQWRRRLVFVGVALSVIAVPAAQADHQFSDVPAASPHHLDVTAIAGAKITEGCGPALYCPGDPVRRDQMASFLRRGLGRATIAGGGNVTLTGTFQDVVTAGITAGGTTGGAGVVLAAGDFSPFAAAGMLGDAAAVEFRIVRDGGGQSNVGMTTLYPATVVSTASASKTYYFPVATGANHFFRLQARLAASQPGDATDVSAQAGSLTLLYVPFG